MIRTKTNQYPLQDLSPAPQQRAGATNVNATQSHKRCPRCGIVKGAEEFNKKHAAKTGLYSYCKACVSDDQKLRRREINAYKRRYYSTEEGRKRRLLARARERAKKNGLDFNLEVDDVILPDTCPYLGVMLSHEMGKGVDKWAQSSLDRVDSTKGYVKGNVQVISYMANVMKRDATVEQLLAFARGIYRTHSGTSTGELK